MSTPVRPARWGKQQPKSIYTVSDEKNNTEKPSAESSNNNNNEPTNQNDDDDKNNFSKKEEVPLPSTAKEVLDVAIGTRKETISATNRILRDLELAKAIEIEALEVLHKDLDRIRRVDRDLGDIDDSVGRSKKLIIALGRKLYRDGCFKIMAALFICGLVVVVVMLAMEGAGKIGSGLSGKGGSNTVVVINSGDAETTTSTPAPPATTTV